MLRLYLSEWKKLLHLRVLVVSFALLLALNGALAVWQAEKTIGAQEWTAEEAEALYALYPAQQDTLKGYLQELKAYAHTQLLAAAKPTLGEAFVETRQGIYTDGLYTGDLALLERLMVDAARPAQYRQTMQAAIENAQVNRREAHFQGYTDEDFI